MRSADVNAPQRVTERGIKGAAVSGTRRRLPVVSSAEVPHQFAGFIDFHGYHAGAGGWFVCGWITFPWAPGQHPNKVLAVLSDMSMCDCTCLTFYERADLHGRGIGFVFFFRSNGPRAGSVMAAVINCASVPHTIRPAQGAGPIEEGEVA